MDKKPGFDKFYKKPERTERTEETNKESRRDSYKDSRRDSSRDKDTQKDPRKDFYKDSRRDSSRDKDTQKDPRKDFYKDSRRDSSRNKDTQKDPRKDFYKDSRRDSPRDSQKDERRDSYKESRKDSLKDSGEPKRKRQRMVPSMVKAVQTRAEDGLIRLNKYLAHSGVCSRREADKFIAAGLVRVNGEVITELGYKVQPTDKVQFESQTLHREKLVYVLLNKPKGFITSLDDPFDRKTVMSLVENAVKERIYPVGRLDRNTTGLLLFTNDGQMAKKLTHPSHRIKKIYHITLDKSLSMEHFNQITEGITLDDGEIKPDALAYVEIEKNKKEIGIEIHSGKNRIVRRIFESLGYQVVKLDRVKFGGLTKKDLPRGKWRFLSPPEINMLKILS